MTPLLLGAAAVGFVHSLLPDHWVPLAVVARTQGWSLLRLARVAALAASGHVLASLVLGAVVALVGLEFQKQIEAQEGHLVGGVLVLTGIALLAWGMSGRAHPHAHDSPAGQSHDHAHTARDTPAGRGDHAHEHAHGDVRHSHRHHHEAFVQAQATRIAERSAASTWVARLSTVAVPFGVAASPDLTFLPFCFAAGALGGGAVAAVLGVFALVTMVTFVGLTVIATAAGYQMRGEWLEENANTITSLVLVAIGVIVFLGV